MKVSLEWDLCTFIKEQQYDVKHPGEILDRAGCLTGTWTEAQAVTPLQYLKQVLPSSFTPIYELMKKFLSFEAEECRCKYLVELVLSRASESDTNTDGCRSYSNKLLPSVPAAGSFFPHLYDWLLRLRDRDN
jgi:hypothetical protein